MKRKAKKEKAVVDGRTKKIHDFEERIKVLERRLKAAHLYIIGLLE
jgi:hypothetical protein